MSILGDIARVSPLELDKLSSNADAYGWLSREAPSVDLDRYWDGLRFAIDAAGSPVNPIGDGRPYPDEGSVWGADLPQATSHVLSCDEVRQASAWLSVTPFSSLVLHLAKANAAGLYPANYDWTSPAVQTNMASCFRMLVIFFHEAATAGECCVFWAA